MGRDPWPARELPVTRGPSSHCQRHPGPWALVVALGPALLQAVVANLCGSRCWMYICAPTAIAGEYRIAKPHQKEARKERQERAGARISLPARRIALLISRGAGHNPHPLPGRHLPSQPACGRSARVDGILDSAAPPVRLLRCPAQSQFPCAIPHRSYLPATHTPRHALIARPSLRKIGLTVLSLSRPFLGLHLRFIPILISLSSPPCHFSSLLPFYSPFSTSGPESGHPFLRAHPVVSSTRPLSHIPTLPRPSCLLGSRSTRLSSSCS